MKKLVNFGCWFVYSFPGSESVKTFATSLSDFKAVFKLQQKGYSYRFNSLPNHHAPSHLGSPIPIVGVSDGEMQSLRQKEANA